MHPALQFLISLAGAAVAFAGELAMTGEVGWWFPIVLFAVVYTALLYLPPVTARWIWGRRNDAAEEITAERLELERSRAEARRKFWDGPGEAIIVFGVLLAIVVLWFAIMMVIALLD